ncbi:hypothetical protein Hamer_G021905 [Homarus americanus]|uniref:Uncharacterized protein n=1 Tax=Homarus americanus TaxID=6706 RepID=A0A8J5NDF8_HOMAM|nr:hypothetical protein Hamer_G021905 [Homarus americanus]
MTSKHSADSSATRTKPNIQKAVTLKTKLEVIKQHECDEGSTLIRKQLSLAAFTVTTINKHTEEIKQAAENVTCM